MIFENMPRGLEYRGTAEETAYILKFAIVGLAQYIIDVSDPKSASWGYDYADWIYNACAKEAWKMSQECYDNGKMYYGDFWHRIANTIDMRGRIFWEDGNSITSAVLEE